MHHKACEPSVVHAVKDSTAPVHNFGSGFIFLPVLREANAVSASWLNSFSSVTSVERCALW